jgi:hypothetical protein
MMRRGREFLEDRCSVTERREEAQCRSVSHTKE